MPIIFRSETTITTLLKCGVRRKTETDGFCTRLLTFIDIDLTQFREFSSYSESYADLYACRQTLSYDVHFIDIAKWEIYRLA
jgi:hypothetical protein